MNCTQNNAMRRKPAGFPGNERRYVNTVQLQEGYRGKSLRHDTDHHLGRAAYTASLGSANNFNESTNGLLIP
jgi:hypothetical protein